MRKYNILATLLICSTLLFGCGQNNETSETSNGITKLLMCKTDSN